MAAKRGLPGCFDRLDPDPGLEPLTVPIHESDVRYGRIEQGGGQPDDSIESFFSRRIQNVQRVYFRQARFLVCGDCRWNTTGGRTGYAGWGVEHGNFFH